MSNEVMNWALKKKLPKGTSTVKHVLTILANQANGDPDRPDRGPVTVFCSTAYLVDTTGLDRKTVLANMALLREWGIIQDTGKRVGLTKQVPVYFIHCAPDLFDQPQKRNRSNIGTVPKSEQSQSQLETVPILDCTGSDIGTRNQEQPRATNESDTRALGNSAGELASGILKVLGVTCGITAQHPKLLEAAAAGVTAQAVIDLAKANPGKPAIYALTVALNQRLEVASGAAPATGQRARAGPARTRANDDFSNAKYVGTPEDELPAELR